MSGGGNKTGTGEPDAGHPIRIAYLDQRYLARSHREASRAEPLTPQVISEEQRIEEAKILLVVEHLTMRFGGLVAIDDVSFNVRRGEITALIGPNGAGKTTVFNCITGFYRPTVGRMAFNFSAVYSHVQTSMWDRIESVTQSGRRSRQWLLKPSETGYLLERMPDYEITAKARIARTFQNIRLFSGMTVLENLIVAQHNYLMRASGWTIGALLGSKRFKNAEAQAVEQARLWLDLIGLTHRADDPAGDLPYGDQRRLEIARAMCTYPRLLCLDEPAAGLNPKESLQLNTLLRTIRDRFDTAILLIEHDMSVVMEISDHVVVLEYGAKIADGTPEEIKNDPAVIAAYLGVEEDEEAAAEAEIDRVAAEKEQRR